MINRKQFYFQGRLGLLIVAWCLLLAITCYGQIDQSNKTDTGIDKTAVSTALTRLKAGSFSAYDAEQIAQAKAVEAAPLLENHFLQSDDTLDKAKIAQVLVQLEYKKDVYWDYLVQLVTPILDSDEPSPFAYDTQGKELPGIPPGFEKWVNANKKNPASALEAARYIHPGEIGLLALTGDPRAVPLLRKALSLPNYLIQVVAAEGLAALKDKDSVSLIIRAAQKAPGNAANLIASSLIYFDSSEAQSALDRLVPKERLQGLREEVAKGKTPFH